MQMEATISVSSEYDKRYLINLVQYDKHKLLVQSKNGWLILREIAYTLNRGELVINWIEFADYGKDDFERKYRYDYDKWVNIVLSGRIKNYKIIN